MVVVALVPEEFAVTQWTLRGGCRELSTFQRSFGFREIVTVLAFTRRAPFTKAGMVGHIIMIKTLAAIVAEVGSAQESTAGIATVVMVVFLYNMNELLRPRTTEDDHMWWVDGH